jgi:hypothetical protein
MSPMPPSLSNTGIKQIIKNDSQAPVLWQIKARILTRHEHPVFLVALIKLNLPGYSTGTVVNSLNSECPCYEFRSWRCMSWQAAPDFRKTQGKKLVSQKLPSNLLKLHKIIFSCRTLLLYNTRSRVDQKSLQIQLLETPDSLNFKS